MSITRQPDAQRIGLLSTRMYMVSLVMTMLVLGLLNALSQTTVAKTEELLSIDHFENLYNKYRTTISCPCQQIAIPRSTFISITPTYHQVRVIYILKSLPLACDLVHSDLFECVD